MPELKFGDTIDPVALYAAVLSTLVFLWEGFKWLRGEASFEVSATPNMFDQMRDPKQVSPLIVIEVRNTGKSPTTITHVVMIAFKSPLHRLLNKPVESAIVRTGAERPLPSALEPGGRFLASGKQTGVAVGWSQHYKLYAGVYHTLSKRPLLARIRPLKTEAGN